MQITLAEVCPSLPFVCSAFHLLNDQVDSPDTWWCLRAPNSHSPRLLPSRKKSESFLPVAVSQSSRINVSWLWLDHRPIPEPITVTIGSSGLWLVRQVSDLTLEQRLGQLPQTTVQNWRSEWAGCFLEIRCGTRGRGNEHRAGRELCSFHHRSMNWKNRNSGLVLQWAKRP